MTSLWQPTAINDSMTKETTAEFIHTSAGLPRASRTSRRSQFKTIFTMFVIILVLLALLPASESKKIAFTNEWAVEIKGGLEEANRVAYEHGYDNVGRIFDNLDIFRFRHQKVKKRSLRASREHHQKLLKHEKVIWAEQQRIKRRVKRDVQTYPISVNTFRDPMWHDTWYLLPSTRPSMRVMEAWQAGYTGTGVVVTILDDGIEMDHPDLKANYYYKASYDINGDDDDPSPRPTFNNENRHGTRCAGEVAAVAGNNYCSVGIAFNASIGGVRMLDGKVTDAVEARSIGLHPQDIDIYSASWGPDDDGRTVDGPATLAKIAFKNGAEVGRGGKGSIFVWASGNGGKKADSCNCDGYTNSIYTLSISSTTENRNKPWYSESCSSTLAATYSSGTAGEKQIVTTDLKKKCTQRHTGTSASAPLAAGICALALEANPSLTWRDMQHLVVNTANPKGLKADDWRMNAVGRNVSHAYGYGLMDAFAMVEKAKTWVHVPVQRVCTINVISGYAERQGFNRAPVDVKVQVDKCDGGVMPDRLEHVQANLSISSDRRGDIEIFLKSGKGTVTQLLERRPLDSGKEFRYWPFMATHMWDEDPRGEWVLQLETAGNHPGTLTFFSLVLHGTLNSDWPDSDKDVQTSTKKSVTGAGSGNRMENIIGSNTSPTLTKSTPRNCKVPTESGLCTVCEVGYIRSPDAVYCLTKCPPGYYMSYETAEAPRASIEMPEPGSKICTACTTGPYCLSCSGPSPNDCSECMDGFQMKYGVCEETAVVQDTSAQSHKIYVLTVAVCIMSVVLFFCLFLFMHYSRRMCKCWSSQPLYEYVPNQTDPDLQADHYGKKKGGRSAKKNRFPGSAVAYTNGAVRNGGRDRATVDKSYSEESDDERSFISEGNHT